MDYYREKESGVTIIELVVVLSIISILLAVSYPTLKTFMPGGNTGGAANILLAKLNYARAKAISEGNNFVWVFNDPAANQYTLYDDNDSTWGTAVDNDLIQTVSLPSGVKFGTAIVGGIQRTTCAGTVDSDGLHLDGANKITFTPQGSANAASLYVIPEEDDENNGQSPDNMRALSTTIIGRVKVWIYVDPCWE